MYTLMRKRRWELRRRIRTTSHEDVSAIIDRYARRLIVAISADVYSHFKLAH
jgi:hypothetical protein